MSAQAQSPARYIYLAASKLRDPVTRNEYLDEACGSDLELRKQLNRLLDADDEDTDSPLQAAIDELGNDTGAEPVRRGFHGTAASGEANTDSTQLDETTDCRSDFSQHRVIGRYKLLEELGQGGMGAVYMAQQSEPVKRKVALKIIKPGMDSREVIARFQAERQALAMMDHPNIARVLDAGTTDEGRPYFVMELVRGIPITKFCEQKKLNLQDRLKLFIDVCKAVQHAHQKAIIHRDLKPSNILVTLHDGEPVVKVIDFGVAKALNQELTEHTLFTQFSQMIGTPLYMSPEQAEMSGLDVDTRSDIYALGVVLYELLTGTTPIERESLAKLGCDAVRKLVLEQEPERPSSRISTLKAGGASTVSNAKRPEQQILAKQLDSELDWIVMKSLEKDRNRRYETANGLAADVQRHLGGEAVAACPPSMAYRFRKVASRNKGLLASAALIFVSLFAGLLTSLWYAKQAQTAKSEAELARIEVEREAEISKAVAAFVSEDLLAQASPNNQPNPAVTLREVVDRAAEKLAGRFEGKPLVEAAIRLTLAETYLEIGRFDQANEHADRALQLRRETLGADDPSTIEPEWLLARIPSKGDIRKAQRQLESLLARARRQVGEKELLTLKIMRSLTGSLISQGDTSAAEKQALETLELVSQTFGASHSEWFAIRQLLAEIYGIQRRDSEAEDLQKDILDERLRTVGEEHPGTLHSMNSLAKLYIDLGRYDEAEQLYQKTYQISLRVLGADHTTTLNAMGGLASVFQHQGGYDKAERLIRKVVDVEKRLLGPEHINTLISTRTLGDLLAIQTRFEEAQELFDELIKVQRRVLGPEHPNTLAALNSLANLYSKQGREDEAGELHAETLELARKTFGKEHPNTLASMGNLANSYRAQARYNEAERLLEEVIETSQRVLGEEHPHTLHSMRVKAAILFQTGRYQEAESLHHLLIEALSRLYGEEHPSTLECKLFLASVFKAQGRYDEAEPLLRNVIEIAKRDLGADNLKTLEARKELGGLLIAQSRYQEAEELFHELIEAQRHILGPDHPSTLSSMNYLASVYNHQARYDEAEKLYAQLIEIARQELGEKHPETLVSMGNLANIYRIQGRFEEAEGLLNEVITAQQAVLGKEHPSVLINMNMLAAQLITQRRYQEADTLLDNLIEVSRRVLGEEHPKTLYTLYMSANLLEKQGRLDDAIQKTESLVEINRRILGKKHLQTLDRMGFLAYLYEKHQRFEEAENLLVEIQGIAPSVLGENHPKIDTYKQQLASLRVKLGGFFQSQGDLESAMDVFDRGIRDEPQNPSLWHARAMLRLEFEETDKAQVDLREALKLVRISVKSDPNSSWNTWSRIALSHYQFHGWKGADEEAELAVKLAENNATKLLLLAPFFLLADKEEEFHELCGQLLAVQDEWEGNAIGQAIKLFSSDLVVFENTDRLTQFSERASKEGPWFAEPEVAIIYARLGHRDAALAAWERTALENPDPDYNPNAYEHPLGMLNEALYRTLMGEHELAKPLFEQGKQLAESFDFQYATSRMQTAIRIHELNQLLKHPPSVNVAPPQ